MLLALTLLVIPSSLRAADAHTNLKTFLNTYCVECHGPDKQKGDRRFDQLNLPVTKADGIIDLQDIIDQLNLGEMPPKKAKQPGPDERRAAIALLTQAVSDARAQFASTGGQTVLRRLNRREYLNTIGDLFHLDMAMFDPTTKFPRDQTVEHLDNIGDALVTSGYLLAQYLDAADQVVEKAFNATERVPERTWTFNGGFQQQPELRYSHGKVFNYRYMCLYETTASVKQEGAYGWLPGFAQGVPADGFYEIKVLAEAKNRNYPYDERIIGLDREVPFRLGIVPGNQKWGVLYHNQPVEPQLAEAIIKDNDPQWYTFKVWLDAGFTPRFTFPNGQIDGRGSFSRILARHKNLFPEEVRDTRGIVEARRVVLQYGHMPHIRIHEVQVRGPLIEQWPPASQRAVLGDKPFEPARMREILESFVTRAYRRPARADEVDRLMSVVNKRIKDGRTPFEAMKDGLKAALCSPAFLYLSDSGGTEKDRALDAWSLASRLSYFLWSTMPDAELMRLARTGELLKPDVLVAQTRRLLVSPKSDAFVTGFLDSWLNLRSLGDMPPDRDAFERYYAQDLQNAMRRETQLFARHLLAENKSIMQFIDADYSFVNRPLAKLYGMPDAVSGAEAHTFQRVKFNTPVRGGLLGHGSILTVSANGVETSPVTRGVWMLENILGTPPSPPPDNVPPIDPDIRGAKSIRDILTKHRDNPTCFDCHQKIDPLGFALENFDPIGAWRAKYEKGQPIDTAGELPGGQAFKDIAGLKQVLVERKDQFARMLATKLLAYACGRRIEPLDRPAVNHIVEELKKGEYGFRLLVEQAVLSEAFRSK
ncbi:MAG: DUF1592 domain-containing protein [Verrucomicrobiota bacterium]